MFTAKRPHSSKVLNDNDSQSLGHIFDNALFSHVNDEATQHKEIEDRINELHERYNEVFFEERAVDTDWFLPRKTPVFALDPFEDVTESDWMEKGYFRKHETRSLSHRLAQFHEENAPGE